MANCSPIGKQWRTVRPLANNGELSELDGWSIQSSGNMFAGMANIDDRWEEAGKHDWNLFAVVVKKFAISDGVKDGHFSAIV